jgi:dinuclear metal center YbgI/SA1388 family protein
MPAPLAHIVAELNRLLEPHSFRDYCPNGLQVPGSEEVTRVVTAVSASAELFERAITAEADLIIVHHGLFWGSQPATIDPPMKRRLKLLFDANISLAAYHLPLDAHPEVGNNAIIARALGAGELQPFALHESTPIGFLAYFPGEGIPADELFARVTTLTARDPLVFAAGPPMVKRIAIVSGGGCDYLSDAILANVDVFITGEPSERVMAHAKESSIHFIAAGHYATETFGVNRLGEHLTELFDVHHEFIDVPNPI